MNATDSKYIASRAAMIVQSLTDGKEYRAAREEVRA